MANRVINDTFDKCHDISRQKESEFFALLTPPHICSVPMSIIRKQKSASDSGSSQFVFPVSRSRNALLVVATLLLILASVYILYRSSEFEKGERTAAVVFAIAGIVFFGFGLIYLLTRLFSSKPALVIDDQGITNNTNFTGGQFIPWNEITGIETGFVRNTRFFLIYVREPEKYISGNPIFKRNLMNINYKTYGTPLSITFQNLKIKEKELSTILRKFEDRVMMNLSDQGGVNPN